MNRNLVERILEKSRDFFVTNKREKISRIDIHTLALQICKQLEEENDAILESRVYYLTKSSLDRLEKTGDYSFIDDGMEVYLRFIDDSTTTIVLESGTLFICRKYDENEEEQFFSSHSDSNKKGRNNYESN
jgi:hypothetical protein